MRLQAAIQGDLNALLQAELAAAARAVTGGIREATAGLKAELRGQITGAGLGTRLANPWRGEIYPRSHHRAPESARHYRAVAQGKNGVARPIGQPTTFVPGEGRRHG